MILTRSWILVFRTWLLDIFTYLKRLLSLTIGFICYSNEFDCRPESEVETILKKKKKECAEPGLMRLIQKGERESLERTDEICIFLYSHAWLAHPPRRLPLVCQENVAFSIFRPLSHCLMSYTDRRRPNEVCPQWTGLQRRIFRCNVTFGLCNWRCFVPKKNLRL